MRGGVKGRRTVRLAAVATAAVLAGTLPGTDSAASGGQGELSLTYACQFTSGEQDVTVAFAQAYPRQAQVGQPIQPGELTATVTVPRAGIAAILPADAAAVTASADLKTHVAQGSSQVDADWPDLAADAVPVTGTDDVEIALKGKVPGVSVTAPGDVAFSVGELALALHPQEAAGTPVTPSPSDSPSADGTSSGAAGTDGAVAPSDATQPATGSTGAAGSSGSSGTTASPTDITALCLAKPGQDTKLATVPVSQGRAGSGPQEPGRTPSGGYGTPGGSGKGGKPPGASSTASGGSADGKGNTIVAMKEPPHSGRTTCDNPPIGKVDARRLPKLPPGAIVLPLPGMPAFPPSPQCAYVDGFADAFKLKGAMIVNDPYDHPAIADVNSGVRKVLDFPKQYVELDSLIAVHLPPSHATFLTYGFMPTTADVSFVSKGLFTVVQTGDDFFNQPILTTVGGYQDLRLRNVKINGTLLDVGPNCHTVTPIDVVLKGRKDEQTGHGDGKPDYDIQDGGPLLADNLTIPPLTGCESHGENFSALLSSAISGSGNVLNLVQGRICDPLNAPDLCQPEIQIPELPSRVHPLPHKK